MRKTKQLRKLIEENEILVAPGAYDPLSAKIIETAGFPLIYMGGFACSAVYLGEPDLGLMSFAEMVDHLGRSARSVKVPIIADADNGYGNAINVVRTVRAYEDAGLAGLHIEDQIMPKRCGHMEGKQIIPVEEMVQKIRAAINSRRDHDFFIIARTDARAVTGFEDAVNRLHAYALAGADMLFLDGPESMEELKTIGSSFQKPVLFNAAITGKSPVITISQARKMGFKLMVYPIELLMAGLFLSRDMLGQLYEKDGFEFMAGRMVSFKEFNKFIGLEKYRELEQQFTSESREVLTMDAVKNRL